MASARPHPPSEQRIDEARAAGHVPHAPLAGFAGGLLALVPTCFWLAPEVAAHLTDLLERPLLAAARGDSALARAEVGEHVRALLGWAALALGAAFVGVVLASALAQGLAFVRMRRVRARFERMAPSRAASLLFCLGLALATGLALDDVGRLRPQQLAARAESWAVTLCLLALGCGVVDAAFARARWFASLFMTRRELLDEQRDAFGDPALRAARARARREVT